MITINITFTVDDFYNVVNSMRDKCGCDTCMRITNSMLAQMLAK
jgi:hypothetical protein